MTDVVKSTIKKCLRTFIPRRTRLRLQQFYLNQRFHINTHLGRFPKLFFAVHKTLGIYQGRLVTDVTDIVIEGAPRVASSYVEHALQICQMRPLKIASHTHAPASVIYAGRLGIPTLVIIREPYSAVRSAILRMPHLPHRYIVDRYYQFYRRLEFEAITFVVADFTEVIENLGQVVDRINQFYGTSFDRYESTVANEKMVFESLLERDQVTGASLLQSYAPNEHKRFTKDRIVINSEITKMNECVKIYESLSPVCNGGTRHA